MSEYITDVAKWKNYSFLNEIWNVYDEFDKNVNDDTKYYRYVGVCERIVENYGEGKSRHKDFCLKLVRNLGCYNTDSKYYNPNNDRCHILYNWIYNKKNNYKNSEEIITKCFDDYIGLMSRVPGNHICFYESYNNVYEDPIKMTILDIFNNNMKSIISKLMDEYEKNDYSPQNFVCECVKIYRYIYNSYCAMAHPREGKGEKTCEKLRELKFIYDTYLLSDESLKNKIPSLDADENEYSNKCISQAKGLESAPVRGGSEKTFSHTTEILGRNTDSSLHSSDVVDGNKGSPMISPVPTALGTVAGASSILALLYKFTPGRRWIHSGFGKQSGRISNDLYAEGPNELLFNGFQGEDMSSYYARYNIGYGST